MLSLGNSCGRIIAAGLLASACAAVVEGLALRQQPPQEPSPTTIRVKKQIVLVDVVVTDKRGEPVRGLTKEDFVLKENGNLQRIANFSFTDAAAKASESQPKPPPLAPNVHTNRREYARLPETLTILLLDFLNTEVSDQSFVRREMIKFLDSQLQGNQRVAILGLGSRLYLLQDFTSDPGLLRAALKQWKTRRSAALASETPPDGLRPDVEAFLGMNPQALESIRQFEADTVADRMRDRVRTTLHGLQGIARITSGYAGRKNLVWVSAGFPIALTPDLNERFRSEAFQLEIRKTTQMLTAARIVIYPVDARGLVGWSPELAASPIPSATGGRRQIVDDAARLFPRRAVVMNTQMAMGQLAEETGGLRFINRNDLGKAVERATADGSTYYTLEYSPRDTVWDGKFRRIDVKLTRDGLRVRHRRGYYAAPNSREVASSGKEREQEFLAAATDPLPARGVTFRARVSPLARARSARVEVEYRVDIDTLSFQAMPGDLRHFEMDFMTTVFSPQGNLLISQGREATAALNAQDYRNVLTRGLVFRDTVEIDPGDYVLRLLVRDRQTGKFGRVDVTLSLAQPGA